MLTDPQKNRLQLLFELKKTPEMSQILLIEELRKTNALLQILADKEWPSSFPRLPAFPDISPTDLTEVVQLLTQLVQKEKEPIDIKLKIL